MRHSQAAANENSGLYKIRAAASGLVRWVVQTGKGYLTNFGNAEVE